MGIGTALGGGSNILSRMIHPSAAASGSTAMTEARGISGVKLRLGWTALKSD